MSTLRQQVSEFHIAMGQPIAEAPTTPSRARLELRLRLVLEEFHELLEAAGYYESDDWSLEKDSTREFDLPAVADALADLDYVIEGARLEFGINGGPIADVVHAANMAKLGGPKSPTGKQLKPPGWTPPDIAGELRKQGWDG